MNETNESKPTDENKEVQLKIDLSQFKKPTSKHSQKEVARRAFKRFKVGLPVTDEELNLISIYYPFLSQPEIIIRKKKEEDAHDAFL